MTTEVVMVRPFLGGEIHQKSKSGFLDVTEMLVVGNKWRIMNDIPLFDYRNWLNSQAVQDFRKSLEKEFGKVYIPGGNGKGKHTWAHPFFFLDLALAIYPDFKIEVYKWLYDQLLQYRNDSGDSYKKMTGALYDKISNKKEFSKLIVDVAFKIKKAVGVEDWEHATEGQLKQREKIQDAISILTDLLPINEAVRLAIKKVLDTPAES